MAKNIRNHMMTLGFKGLTSETAAQCFIATLGMKGHEPNRQDTKGVHWMKNQEGKGIRPLPGGLGVKGSIVRSPQPDPGRSLGRKQK